MAFGSRIITICLNPAIDRVVQVPQIQGGAHVIGRTLLRQPAGKAVNVSRSLAKLGSSSTLIGFIGHHEQPWFTQTLQAMQPGRITCHWLPLPQPTRESITLIDTTSHRDMHIREAGFSLTATDWQTLVDTLLQQVTPGDIITFAGSPPQGISPSQLLKLCDQMSQRRAHLVIDMSGPTLTELLHHPPSGLLLVKPNLSEFAHAIGQPTLTLQQLPDAMCSYTSTIPWLIVSLGSQGVMAAHQGKIWRGQLTLDPSQVVDTVGCGDAMLAGCLQVLTQLAIPDTPVTPTVLLTTALSVAAANATVAGAGNFDPAFAHQLQSRCMIESLPVGQPGS